MGGDPKNDRKERIPPTFEDGPIYPPPRAAPPAVAGAAKPLPPTPSDAPAALPQAAPLRAAQPAQAAAPQAAQPAQAAAPHAAQPAQSAAQHAAPPAQGAVFVSDAAAGPDALGRAAPLARLSELIAHRGAQGPLSIALLGGPGSGKSHALMDVVEGASLLATAALSASGGPFLSRIVTLRLEAPDLGDEPEAAIAERLHARLAREYPHVAQAAAEEAAQSSADPRQTARALADHVDESRRRLAAERAARDEAATRRARLAETVLYETPGSQIDAYARAHRGRIEPALRSFGFSGADPIADYKGLVQTLSETGGGGNRLLASLRALFAYKGQKKLIVFGVVLFLLAWLLAAMAADPSWLAPMQESAGFLKSSGAWLSAHLSAFAIAATIAKALGLLCFALLAWRAWRFAQPLWRGAGLLDLDIAARKSDLDHQIAHHAQRVEALVRDSDALAERAAEADRRAGGAERAFHVAPAFLRAGPSRTAEARAYLAALDALFAGAAKGAGAAPGRYVIAIDSLDRLPPEKGLAVLSSVAAALARPAFALITAFDPRHFDGLQGAGVALSRLVQTPFTLAAADAPGWSAFVERLAGRAAPAQPRARAPQNGSTLDSPLGEPEVKLLAALADMAGPSPRGVNRLVNLYRLARHDAPDDLAGLACQLALAIGGSRPERDAVARALTTSDPAAPFAAPEAGPRVAAGLAAAAAAQGGPVTTASAKRAAAVARMWTL